MSTPSIARRACLFAFLLAPLLTGAVDASANTQFWNPGIACRSPPVANMGASWSSLGNWTGSTQTAWCPLYLVNGDSGVNNINVLVTAGWATTSSCYIAEMSDATHGIWYNPNSIVHNNSTTDSVTFSIPNPAYVDDEVQCDIPNGQLLLSYNQY
jgi:hypothetical protein